MNKLLIIPLAVMLLLSVFVIMYSAEPETYDYETDTYTTNITINDTTSTIEVPKAGDMSINLLGGGLIIFLGLVIAVATISGFSVFGSGLSVFSQRLIFLSAIFLGLWGALSYISYSYITDAGTFGTILWLGLTFIYILGFTGILMGGGGDD